MAASTIAAITITDDTGSASAPNGDGTIVNNSWVQTNIVAKINAMFAGAGAYATFTLAGKFAVEGFGAHSFSAGGTGGQSLSVRNTTAGTGNSALVEVGNDSSATRTYLQTFSTTYTPSGPEMADGTILAANGAGGLSIYASHASGDIRAYTNGVRRGTWFVSGGFAWGDSTDPGAGNFRAAGTSTLVGTVTTSGDVVVGDDLTVTDDAAIGGDLTIAGTAKGSGQPGFLAYNSAADTGVSSGATIDFNTEVYDELGNFATDTFTAPVAGRYLLSAGVGINDASAAIIYIHLVTSNHTYILGSDLFSGGEGDVRIISGAMIVDMDAADTAYIVVTTTSGTVTIEGESTPPGGAQTWFSGRLMV